jgi:hypothetical protein
MVVKSEISARVSEKVQGAQSSIYSALVYKAQEKGWSGSNLHNTFVKDVA